MKQYLSTLQNFLQKLPSTRTFMVFLLIYTALDLFLVRENFLWLVIYLLVTLGSGFIFWLIAGKITGKKKDWQNLVISGLIVFLVWHYGVVWDISTPLPWVYLVWPMVAMLGAVLVKFFGYYKNAVSLLNPAAAGLLLATLAVWISEQFAGTSYGFISWWGVNAGGWPTLILALFWTLFGTWKFRKQALVLSFLLFYAAGLFISQHIGLLTYTFTDATIYFLAAVMLAEPKSSPALPKQQMLTGVLAGIFFFAGNLLSIPYAEVWTIILVNVLNVYFRWKMMRQSAGRIAVAKTQPTIERK